MRVRVTKDHKSCRRTWYSQIPDTRRRATITAEKSQSLLGIAVPTRKRRSTAKRAL